MTHKETLDRISERLRQFMLEGAYHSESIGEHGTAELLRTVAPQEFKLQLIHNPASREEDPQPGQYAALAMGFNYKGKERHIEWTGVKLHIFTPGEKFWVAVILPSLVLKAMT